MSFSPQMQEAEPIREWTGQGMVACRFGDRTLAGVLETPVADGEQIELRRRFRILKSAYDGRGMAMAVAGHDLRQPLQVIGMVLARLAARTGDERDLSWLDIANGEIARLSAGLDHLAVLSRDDDCADGAPVTGEVCLDALLAETAAAWTHHARAKGLDLRLARTGVRVRSNARLLSVIIGNLISNAIKYTDHGRVLVGARRRGAAVVIEVIDTGRGFSDASDAVFTAFWREDNDSGGLGLGLSIVRRTADLLGHAVTIRSVRDRGSTVSVAVPRSV